MAEECVENTPKELHKHGISTVYSEDMEALITGEIDADGADFSEKSEHEVVSSDVRFNIKRPENPQRNIAVDEEARNRSSGDDLPVSLV